MDLFNKRKVRYFKDLNVEGFIYRLNPYTQKVEGLKIRDIHGVYEELIASKVKHPTPEMYKHFVKIVCYMPEGLVHSPDLNNIPTIPFVLDGRLEVMLTMQKTQNKVTLPIPVSATRKALEEWMERTK